MCCYGETCTNVEEFKCLEDRSDDEESDNYFLKEVLRIVTDDTNG